MERLEAPAELWLTRQGVIGRLAARMRPLGPPPVMRLALLAAILGWLIPALLTLLHGITHGREALLPFFTDLTAAARSLVAVPLLIVGEWLVDLHVADAGKRFRVLCDPATLPRLERVMRGVSRWSNPLGMEVLVLLLAWLPAILRLLGVTQTGGDQWYLGADGHTPSSAAGWWYALVSVPMLPFLLLRWIWRYAVWTCGLFLISRLPLRLIPSFPDGAGGLEFISRVQASFAPLVGAVSTVIASSWAESVRLGITELQAYRVPLLVIVVGVTLLFMGPPVAFTWKLTTERIEGQRPFDLFVTRYHREFDARWIHGLPKESALGSADIQSLADVNNAFAAAHTMRARLIDLVTAKPLLLATLLPMLIPIISSVPLSELLTRLAERLV